MESQRRAMAQDHSEVLVSIGLPVYNGGAELQRALERILAQTHRHWELVICDNGSTDGTPALCRKFASLDPRVRYRPNETNIGATANFGRVAQLSRGDYFMWASHDDYWAPTFIEENLRNLLANPGMIASMSALQYIDGDRVVSMPFIVRADTRALIGSMQANIRHYVANSGMNSRFYALFKRDVLLQCLPYQPYCGADNALIVRTLAFGNYGEVNRTSFFRGVRGASSDHHWLLAGDRQSLIGRFLPLWQYTREVWRMPHVKREMGLVISLFTVNTVFVGFLLLTLATHWFRQLLPGRRSSTS